MTQVVQQETGRELDEDAILCPVLHHVGITTSRMPEMLDFYGKVLGMYTVKGIDVRDDTGNVAGRIEFLTNDRANHRLTMITNSRLTESGVRSGVCRAGQHLAFEYNSIDELFQTYKRLKKLGIKVGMCEAHGPSTNMYLHDPDKNTVELRVDNFGDWDASRNFLANVDNPRGAGTVDFDKMIEARAAGATPEELFERALAGEFPPSYEPDMTVMG